MKMPGHESCPIDGRAGAPNFSWIIEGRWLGGRLKGMMPMLNREYESFSISGFDNYRQNWVTTVVSNFDTAMLLRSRVFRSIRTARCAHNTASSTSR